MNKILTGPVALTSPPTPVKFGGAVVNFLKKHLDAWLTSMYLGRLMTKVP